jgi:hypothetical protein
MLVVEGDIPLSLKRKSSVVDLIKERSPDQSSNDRKSYGRIVPDHVYHLDPRGYVTARVVECAFIAVGFLSLLTVVTLRQEAATGTDVGSLVVVGQSLVALHGWTFVLGPGFVVGVGNGLMLGYLMYKSRLVPRGMAMLGLIGGPLIIASGAAVVLGVIEAGGRCRLSRPFRSSCGSCRSASGSP